MARYKRSHPTLRLERALVRQTYWEGFSDHLTADDLREGRLIEVEEQLRGGTPIGRDGQPHADLLARREKYVDRLVKLSNWKRTLRPFMITLPIEAQESLETLVIRGGVPHMMKDSLEQFIRNRLAHETAKKARAARLNAKHLRTVAKHLNQAADHVVALYKRESSPLPGRIARLSADLRKEAKITAIKARSRMASTPKRAELALCIELWDHLAVTCSAYHDETVGRLLDALAPRDNRPREVKMLARRRKIHQRDICRPGQLILGWYPTVKIPLTRR